ncbi:hypothetical protein ABIG07_005415 [Bradyrhizobium ottawaense]|uniref:Tripartite tricarboxylate transporter substrate binding protein n=1 Tax=Bradyrhizobium ottawaense TaxID=931866 RepID=A0ABV4FYX2_9BRAD
MRGMKRLAAAIFLFGGCLVTPAWADNYPLRPIRLLHGFAAGGAADTLSRIIADGLSKKLGQPIIVEAKPGAGGNIAADAVAKAAPDGYTLGLVTGAHAISAATYKSLAYQPAESFEMISTLVYYALVIAVRSDYPAKSLGELIAMAKAKPGSLSFGSVGFGSTHHLAGELLNATAGIEIVHVPYRGDSQSTTALLGGDVPVIVGTPVLLAPQIQSGRDPWPGGDLADAHCVAARCPDRAGSRHQGLRRAHLGWPAGAQGNAVRHHRRAQCRDAGRTRGSRAQAASGDRRRRRGPRQLAGGDEEADRDRDRQMDRRGRAREDPEDLTRAGGRVGTGRPLVTNA